jgi:class 3 adenylate cyclase
LERAPAIIASATARNFSQLIQSLISSLDREGRFDYAAIGTVSNVASRLCDEAKPGQILFSARVLTKVENAVKVEPVGEFELKGIRRPLAAYNVVAAQSSEK